MPFFETWVYPNSPPKTCANIFNENKKLVIVGVIGKSAFNDCSKMAGINVIDLNPSNLKAESKDEQIRFYYSTSEEILFLHFQTTYDQYFMQHAMEKEIETQQFACYLIFYQYIKNRFARILLFAIQVCHIVLFVEQSVTFDSSLIAIFKSLKLIRERHVNKFLPKLLKNSPLNAYLGKSARMCSPRCLFLFEKYPNGYDQTEESTSKLEFEIEDNIYKIFKNELLLPNKSGVPLFSLPGNKRFVYYNTDTKIREDPVLNLLKKLPRSMNKNRYLKDKTVNSVEDIGFFGNFGISSVGNIESENNLWHKRSDFMTFLKDHVNEALQFGFDDGVSKFKNRGSFMVHSVKTWYDMFKFLHIIFIQNPDNADYVPVDPAYKSFLDNFDKLMDIDDGFFSKCCENGIKKAGNFYLNNYEKSFQKAMIDGALSVYSAYARGPNIEKSAQTLVENFELSLLKDLPNEYLAFRSQNSTSLKQSLNDSC